MRFAGAQSGSPGYIDVHMHLDGRYRQQGGESGGPGGRRRPGGPGRGPGGPGGEDGGSIKDYESAAVNLISRMDRMGVAKALIMPPPQKSNQKGGYTYKDLLEVVRKHPDRLALAGGGGELNPMIVGTDSSAVTAAIKAEFEKKAEEIVGDGARAFGEMTALHFSFHEGHPFEQVAADHPLFLLLADIAARYNIPVDLHMEAVLKDRSLPPRPANMSSANPSTIKATIPGFERLLDHNKSAKIVWQHVGWDNTGEMTPDLVRRLLQAHSNLYCAIHESRQILDENGKIREAWMKLITDYPDRFMIGADTFIGIPGKTKSKGPDMFDKTWLMLNQLPPDLAQKIGRTNAARVYGLN